MSIFDNIAKQAIAENKNILILGTPRSGTHALGSMLANNYNFRYNGEILRLDPQFPWEDDLNMLKNHSGISVSQVVQYSSKIKLSNYINNLKKHITIINLRRRDKLKQFASWVYFNRYHNEKAWHSQTIEFDQKLVGKFIITQEDIELFLVEQLVDSYYTSAYTLYYEDLSFDGATQSKNIYKFDITTIFANLDFVKSQLEDWKYIDE
jgi:hypothetical protein